MSELLALSSRDLTGDTEVADLMGFADVVGSCRSEIRRSGDWLMTECHREDAPLGGLRSFSDDRWTAVFAGDLVDHETVPFAEVIVALDTNCWDFLAGLNGIFTFVVHDKRDQRLFGVSDRRSQKPLFYSLDAQGACVSSNLAVFARLPNGRDFNEEWLWQLLFFNFPVDDSTFFKDVKRVPAACVMTFDSRSDKFSMGSYAGLFKPQLPLLKGKEALSRATQVFGTRVIAHYHGADSVACALTGGWDGRTMLALAPADNNVTPYTYGVPGCTDLTGARATATLIGAEHLEIPFNRGFVDDLPHHVLETVYLSSGLQGALRSTLHYVYHELTQAGRRFPLTISGISLGTQLRGAAQYPDLISMELARRFQGLDAAHTKDYWRTIFGPKDSDFTEFTHSRIELMQEQFGPFERPEHHFSYILYPASAHYFCGELAIADKFTTVRVPAWDSKIVELMYSIENSTLSYSHFVGQIKQVRRKEMVLQAHLLKEFSPDLYRIPVRGIHPAAVLAGEVPYQMERAYRSVERKVSSRLSTRANAPLEDWNVWLFDRNRQFVADLLESSDTMVGDFVEPSFIKHTITTRNVRMLGKLLTTEIILRLVKNGWQRFW